MFIFSFGSDANPKRHTHTQGKVMQALSQKDAWKPQADILAAAS